MILPVAIYTYIEYTSDSSIAAISTYATAQLAEQRIEPNSGLGRAIAYLLAHWTPLTLFLRQPGARWTTTSLSGPSRRPSCIARMRSSIRPRTVPGWATST
jgi:hypothetical protein